MLTKRGCQGCGAPLPEHTTTCAYCGSTHDNVTMALSKWQGGSSAMRVTLVTSSNVMSAPVFAAQRTVVMAAISTAQYDTYFDGTSIRRVRAG